MSRESFHYNRTYKSLTFTEETTVISILKVTMIGIIIYMLFNRWDFMCVAHESLKLNNAITVHITTQKQRSLFLKNKMQLVHKMLN